MSPPKFIYGFVSESKISFKIKSWDVRRLFDLNDDLLEPKVKNKILELDEKLEALNKSAVVFITACWESYIKDLCDESFKFLMKKDVVSGFNKWSKVVLIENKNILIKSLNTPKTSKVDNLFFRVIGLKDLSSNWKTRGLTSKQAASKLNNYMKMRGSIAHRAVYSKNITRKVAEDYLNFIEILVNVTERAVQNYVKELTKHYFNKISVG